MIKSNSFFGRSIGKKFMFMGGILIFLIILSSTLSFYFQIKSLDGQFIDGIKETKKDFFDLEKESIRALSATLEVVINDPELKKVYLEKDRQKLFNYSQPLFYELKEKYGISHFYFILPDGVVFTRVHNPDLYGDTVRRSTFLQAMETKDIGSGVELGQTAYALRVVMPYYQDEELIGYVELGQEIDIFLETMKKGRKNEFMLVAQKEFLNKTDWESVKNRNGLKNNWGDFNEFVVVEATTTSNLSCFSENTINSFKNETYFIEKLKLKNKTFACGSFGVIGPNSQEMGTIFSFIDVTNEQDRINLAVYVYLGFFILICFVLAYTGFYFSRNILNPLKKIKKAIEQLERGNYRRRIDIQTGDEFEQVGDSFNRTAFSLGELEKEHKQLENSKTEFLSITSHELRSPMTPMKAQLQMLMEDYFGKLNDQQKNSVDIVLRNTERLDGIIQDFLEISRIESARLKFNFIKISLNEPVKRVIEEMKGFLPEKNIKVYSKIEKLPIIEVDPDRVMQVFRNLINNAKKFSPKNSKILITGEVKNDMIEFSVKDEGVGVKMSDQRRLFEPFFQVDNMYQHKSGGTGLGLAIIKGIIKSQNGEVWLESQPQKGTTFKFTVPLKPVLKSKSIKLLFSMSPELEKKILNIFLNYLGPIGPHIFEKVREKSFEYVEIIKNLEELRDNKIIDSITFDNLKYELGYIFQIKPSQKRVVDVSKEIEELYVRFLGPVGKEEFSLLDVRNEEKILKNIDELEKSKILNYGMAEKFRECVTDTFTTKYKLEQNNYVGLKELDSAGMIRNKETKINNAKDIQGNSNIQLKKNISKKANKISQETKKEKSLSKKLSAKTLKLIKKQGYTKADLGELKNIYTNILGVIGKKEFKKVKNNPTLKNINKQIDGLKNKGIINSKTAKVFKNDIKTILGNKS